MLYHFNTYSDLFYLLIFSREVVEGIGYDGFLYVLERNCSRGVEGMVYSEFYMFLTLDFSENEL